MDKNSGKEARVAEGLLWLPMVMQIPAKELLGLELVVRYGEMVANDDEFILQVFVRVQERNAAMGEDGARFELVVHREALDDG